MKKAHVRAVSLADGMSTSLSLAPLMFRLCKTKLIFACLDHGI